MVPEALDSRVSAFLDWIVAATMPKNAQKTAKYSCSLKQVPSRVPAVDVACRSQENDENFPKKSSVLLVAVRSCGLVNAS
jgi:hypothetical protein